MTSSGQQTTQQSLRWDMWWRWALASLIGAIVGSTLYYVLPFDLRYPLADENIWLAEPWRIAALNCVFYIPISFAQWLILRQYVDRVGWWPIATIGSVVVVYPGSIWILWNLGQWVLADAIWFLGLGGISIYIVAQGAALLALILHLSPHDESDQPHNQG